MRRQRSHPTEIVGRIDEPAAKMILPDSIDDRASSERILRIDDPLGQGRTRLASSFESASANEPLKLDTQDNAPGSTNLPDCGHRHAPADRSDGESAAARPYWPRYVGWPLHTPSPRGAGRQPRGEVPLAFRPHCDVRPAALHPASLPTTCRARPSLPCSPDRCRSTAIHGHLAGESVDEILFGPHARLDRVEARALAPVARFFPPDKTTNSLRAKIQSSVRFHSRVAVMRT